MHINFDKLELQINNHSVTKIIDFTALMLLNPDGIYLFKMQNGKTRVICEICSKITINKAD